MGTRITSVASTGVSGCLRITKWVNSLGQKLLPMVSNNLHSFKLIHLNRSIISARNPVELSKIKTNTDYWGDTTKSQGWKYWSSTKKVFEKNLDVDGQWLEAEAAEFMVIEGVN